MEENSHLTLNYWETYTKNIFIYMKELRGWGVSLQMAPGSPQLQGFSYMLSAHVDSVTLRGEPWFVMEMSYIAPE